MAVSRPHVDRVLPRDRRSYDSLVGLNRPDQLAVRQREATDRAVGCAHDCHPVVNKRRRLDRRLDLIAPDEAARLLVDRVQVAVVRAEEDVLPTGYWR